jgi:outer membrane protein assembly factor BamC
MEIFRVTFPQSSRVLAALSCLAVLASCSSVDNMLSGDKVDYKSNAAARPVGLEVPPDLTQLSKDSRYQQPNGAISASTFQAAPAAVTAAAAPAPVTVPTVAVRSVGAFKMERQGTERWLSTTLTPEEVYPQVRTFWKDNGFTLIQDRAEAGVLETDWAENRAKLPDDVIRNTIGKLFDSAYSTGELDKFTTRIERSATGSDIFITHRGLAEVYIGDRKDATVWQPRPADPQLEATFLSRLMVKLGAKEELAKATVAAAAASGPAGPPRARIVEGRPAQTLQLDDGFDRAWRRVGIALDRSGFTVEDRDRGQGLYFVRYVDPAYAGREEPNFITRMFKGKKADETGLAKYRVKVTAEGPTSTVAILDSQGGPETGEPGKKIANLLLDDLR